MLSQLCRDLPVTIRAAEDSRVDGITLDSRKVQPGIIFAAAIDAYRNGEDYIRDAVSRKATAVMAARDPNIGDTPLILTENVRQMLGVMAHRIEGDPTKDMLLIAVTGTNAKTTFTYVMEAILIGDGRLVGAVGTVTHRYGGQEFSAPNTTPEAPALARFFRKMHDFGVRNAVIEASSHGLSLERVAGCRFNVGVFTNLSRDHLDFHRDDEDYLAAKMKLFTQHLKSNGEQGLAIINIDDPAGKRIAAACRVRTATYGENQDAAYRIESYAADSAGLALNMMTPQGALSLRSPLLGHFQAYNIAAAVATALELSIPKETIIDAIESMPCVPGRMERVPDDDIDVIVDYAHTPAAVQIVTETARKMARGRLITIFGCGGDRDHGKRPLMAGAAASASDITVVTSDNPRTEDPSSIISDILGGVDLPQSDRLEDGDLADYEGRQGIFVEGDRRKAIRQTIQAARSGDLILIVGKGHEDYQIIGKEKFHLDDREEAKKALAARHSNNVKQGKL